MFTIVKPQPIRKVRKIALVAPCLAACLIFALPIAHATELKPETVAAFNLYIQASKAQMDADLRAGRFLVVDRLSDSQRGRAYDDLQHGHLYIAPQKTLQDGRSIRIPNGIIHHWAGTVYIPGCTLEQADDVLKDFDDKPLIYKPEVQRSQLAGRDGDVLKLSMRWYYKSIVTVVYDVLFDVHPLHLDDRRILIRSYSTRIAEVKDAAQPDEHELPVGKDDGFLWRMCSYWHLEEKDGGVYVGLETIALSRGIPPIFVPVVKPLTESIPRKILADLLQETRAAVVGDILSAPAAVKAN
jgi:hypothetical protein